MSADKPRWREHSTLSLWLALVAIALAACANTSPDNSPTIAPSPTATPTKTPVPSYIYYHPESRTINTSEFGVNTGDIANHMAENGYTDLDIQARLSCRAEIEFLNPSMLTPVVDANNVVVEYDIAPIVHYRAGDACVVYQTEASATAITNPQTIIQATATAEALSENHAQGGHKETSLDTKDSAAGLLTTPSEDQPNWFVPIGVGGVIIVLLGWAGLQISTKAREAETFTNSQPNSSSVAAQEAAETALEEGTVRDAITAARGELSSWATTGVDPNQEALKAAKRAAQIRSQNRQTTRNQQAEQAAQTRRQISFINHRVSLAEQNMINAGTNPEEARAIAARYGEFLKRNNGG